MKRLSNFNKDSFDPKKVTDDNVDTQKKIQEALDKYSHMDENGLINELIKRVRMERANGTYDGERMMSTIDFIRPHLSDAQHEKLVHLIELLNSEEI